MKKNWIRKILIIFGMAMPLVAVAQNLSREKEQPVSSTKSVSRYTIPNSNVTFTIVAPVKVSVGQIFAIDYTIETSKFTNISQWTDLFPDAIQGMPIKLIDIIHPTYGTFKNEESLAEKGGRGIWLFPKGLQPGTILQLRLMVQATSEGLLKYSTMVMANPPFYIENAGTLITKDGPVASPIHVRGRAGKPLEVSVLDYIVANSQLTIKNISPSSYGSVFLNDDYTITYISNPGYYGNDSFSYNVVDEIGNEVHGLVFVTIDYAPAPQIIQ